MDTQSQIVRNLSDPAIVLDLDGRIQFANSAFSYLFNYRESELEGIDWVTLVLKNTSTTSAMAAWQDLQSGKNWKGELIWIRKNGSHFRGKINAFPIGNSATCPFQFCIILKDVTESERIRAVLTRQSQLLTELSNRIPGLIYQFQWFPEDEHGFFPYTSSAVRKMFGCTPEDLALDWGPALKCIVEEDRQLILQTIREAARNLSEWKCAFRVHLPDEPIRWYQGSSLPEKMKDGSILFHGYLHDISQQKEIEFALEEYSESLYNQNLVLENARREVGQASRAKSQFLANMSHEIRTPMNGVIGAASLLEETSLTEDQHDFLEILQTSCDSLMTVINDILDFSQWEKQSVQIEETVFDLRQLLHNTERVLTTKAIAKGIQFSCTIEEPIPDSLIGDPNRLRQVLMNVATNAIKFTNKGAVSIRVHQRSLSASHHFFEFEVKDTGIGIPQSKQAQIFEAFSQVDGSNTRQYGGTGLGLTVCKMLLDAMGGHIEVQSLENKGSIFTFSVPLKTSLDDLETDLDPGLAPQKTEIQAVAGQPYLSKKTTLKANGVRHDLLLVEDDPTNRRVLQILLSQMGHTVYCAENGKQAIQLLRKKAIGLVFMDCQMPVMDGFEATRRIRSGEAGAANRDVPIVALTAMALSGDNERCRAAGMNDYLSKPVQRHSLQSITNEWIAAPT